MEMADSWHQGMCPSSHQAWLDSFLTALKNLADAGLGAALVLVNLHHRRIVPLEDHVWLEDRWMVASLCDE
jgi:hypothetical protein